MFDSCIYICLHVQGSPESSPCAAGGVGSTRLCISFLVAPLPAASPSDVTPHVLGQASPCPTGRLRVATRGSSCAYATLCRTQPALYTMENIFVWPWKFDMRNSFARRWNSQREARALLCKCTHGLHRTNRKHLYQNAAPHQNRKRNNMNTIRCSFGICWGTADKPQAGCMANGAGGCLLCPATAIGQQKHGKRRSAASARLDYRRIQAHNKPAFCCRSVRTNERMAFPNDGCSRATPEKNPTSAGCDRFHKCNAHEPAAGFLQLVLWHVPQYGCCWFVFLFVSWTVGRKGFEWFFCDSCLIPPTLCRG